MFRFAPSPTDDIDIETLRLALLNYICAMQADDKLLLRIENLDMREGVVGDDQALLEMLALFGVEFTDVTYQSHNLKFHQQLATKLLMDKNAFSCFCTSSSTQPYNGTCENLSDDEVLNNESPFSVRIRSPKDAICFSDKIKSDITIDKESIDSFTILNVDKSPTPTFASALDDLLSDISMIVRSQEHITDSAKQILIRNYLGYDKEISYAHLPHILNQDGEKISQADDAYSLKWLLEEGFLPAAITNHLIMIGNSSTLKISTLKEAVTWFDITKISDSPAAFDINQLKEINKEHIKRLPALEVAKYIGYSSKDLGELAKIYTEECSTINEIKTKIDAIFSKKEPLGFQEESATLVKVIKEAPYFKEFDAFKAHLISESGLEEKKLLQLLGYLLTGTENHPNLGDIYPHIKNYLGEIIQ